MPTSATMHECFAESASGTTIIFDLDGTLIDSRQAILECWGDALTATGLKNQVALDDFLIGPSARQVAEVLTGNDQPETAEELFNHFIRAYDNWGWRRCIPFNGVDLDLRHLANSGPGIHLVTNKRSRPTRAILTALGWLPLFKSIHSPDDLSQEFRSKPTMLADLLEQWSIEPRRAAYVGDTPQDQAAAEMHGLRFITAWWGDAAKHFPQPLINAA